MVRMKEIGLELQSLWLAPDGSVLAVGSYLNDGTGSNSGQVIVYQLVNEEWNQIGSELNGESKFDYFGISVSLSTDGNVLAVGASGNDRFTAGHVRVYRLVEGDWMQVGSSIQGENGGDNFGGSISLSGDGTMMAVGAWQNDGNGSNSGHARVYQWVNDTSWTPAGSDIDGLASGDQFGVVVSLSANGNVLAVGADESDVNGENAGRVRVFQWRNEEWAQISVGINGNNKNDGFGISVALSADGTTVATGAWQNFKEGYAPGYAKVYRLT